MTSCDSEPELMERFQSELVGDMNMEILKDIETGLVWVNDTRGCFAAIINPTHIPANDFHKKWELLEFPLLFDIVDFQ